MQTGRLIARTSRHIIIGMDHSKGQRSTITTLASAASAHRGERSSSPDRNAVPMQLRTAPRHRRTWAGINEVVRLTRACSIAAPVHRASTSNDLAAPASESRQGYAVDLRPLATRRTAGHVIFVSATECRLAEPVDGFHRRPVEADDEACPRSLERALRRARTRTTAARECPSGHPPDDVA